MFITIIILYVYYGRSPIHNSISVIIRSHRMFTKFAKSLSITITVKTKLGPKLVLYSFFVIESYKKDCPNYDNIIMYYINHCNFMKFDILPTIIIHFKLKFPRPKFISVRFMAKSIV